MQDEKIEERKEVRLLWTGGWDPTFRLLDLVLVRGIPTQPFYVLDTARRSSIVELDTMQKIRRGIAELSPSSAGLVKPSAIVSIHDIAADADVTARYTRLKKQSFLGEQYDWLARFVKQFDLHGLELCVHVDDKAHTWLNGNVKKLDAVDSPAGDCWVLRDDVKDADLSVFGDFRFPLLTLTKTDMEAIARKNGFLHIMEQTWFCFSPIRNRPCGTCNPCQYAMQEGMRRRIPRAARIRHLLLPVSRPLRRVYEKVERLRAASRRSAPA